MNKKGISPLIGTVLLVAIVIAMILLIMPWVTNMIRQQQAKTTEATKKFDCVTELNFDLSQGATGIMVDNRGSVGITKLVFRKFDVAGALVGTPVTEEAAAGSNLVDAYGIESFPSVSCTETGVVRVEALATIMSGGKALTCGENPREYNC